MIRQTTNVLIHYPASENPNQFLQKRTMPRPEMRTNLDHDGFFVGCVSGACNTLANAFVNNTGVSTLKRLLVKRDEYARERLMNWAYLFLCLN